MMIRSIRLAALALIAATVPALARDLSCEGPVVILDDRHETIAIGKCWSEDPAFKALILDACEKGENCKVVGAGDNASMPGMLTRIDWAQGRKGMSFKMKPCPSCVESLKKALEKKQ